MENIILIETSTALCSTALVENGVLASYRESSAPKAHASLTAVFIQEMLDERGLTLADCDAICVSKGPGSYTGLRVGVSTAKGLCFGSGKPLIAVGTLDTLVFQALSDNTPINEDGTPHVISDVPHTNACDTPHVISDVPHTNACGTPHVISDVPHTNACDTPHVIARSEATWQSVPFKYIIPMIDARRMEVYTAVFKIATTPEESRNDVEQITETAPMIIDENSFAEYLEQGPCLFIGDGAGKCADVLKHPNAHFRQCYPEASSMLAPALAALKAGDFKDVAYFEPFYLKEFVATVSKKKLF